MLGVTNPISPLNPLLFNRSRSDRRRSRGTQCRTGRLLGVSCGRGRWDRCRHWWACAGGV